MITHGVIWADGTKELRSILVDENGNLRIEDSLKSNPREENWVAPQIVPLIKIEKPQEGNWTDTLVWFEDRVERQWQEAP